MNAEQTAESAVSMSPPGKYPVPAHRRPREVVERVWDGVVWGDEISPAAEGETLPKYHRRFFGFLRSPGWKLLLLFVIPAIIATVLWSRDTDAKWIHGIQIPLPLFVGLATFSIMLTLILFIGRRVGFDRIPTDTRKTIIKWGIASAVLGFAFAMAVEILIPKLFGWGGNAPGSNALAGPAEETGKILLPVALWLRGLFRLPREGYLLVLVSAGVFGIMESFEYGISPDGWSPGRPLLEVMHPLLTGFVAAVAWQVAWKRGHFFTAAAFGAWVVAMVAHSTNDVVVLDPDASKLLSGITVTVVVVMYLLQKHAARQLVPPDNVGKVSPRWRPVAPKHAESAS